IDYPGTVMDVKLRYDDLNRLTNAIDMIGTTTFTYDNGGMLLSEGGPWTDDTVNYGYDGHRRVSMSILQPNASSWLQTYVYDQYNRLTNTTPPAGSFNSSYAWGWLVPDRIARLDLPGSYIENSFDLRARLISTTLRKDIYTILNQHSYDYDDADQRT